MPKAIKFLERVILFSIYGVVALIPVFFLPFTSDAVEFNKQFLLYFLVTLGMIGWICKVMAEKKLVIRKTPLNIPLLLVAAVSLISAIVSKNRILSFWGDYTVNGNSFISFSFYALLYFLVLNNIDSAKQAAKLVKVLIGSAVVSTIYFIVQSFGLLPWKNLPIPRWTIASDLPTQFGYFLVIALIAVLSLIITKKQSFWNKGNIFGILASAIIFGGIVLLGFKSVWLITAIAVFLFLVFSLSRIDEVCVPWVSVSFGIMVVAILFILLGQPKFLTANLPTEVALSTGVSWKITVSSLSENLKNFLLGAGPGTFIYEFSAHRPEIFNNNFAWSIRFGRPSSTALEILANTGLLGAVAWIAFFLVAIGTLFVAWFVRNIKTAKKAFGKFADFASEERGDIYAHTVFSGLLTCWFILFISMFFICFTTVHWVLFFLFLALAFLVGTEFSKKEGNMLEISLKTMPQYTLVASFVYILFFAVVIVFLIFLGRFYTAEVYKAKAMKYTAVGNHTRAAEAMFKAVSMNPSYSKYYLDLASAYIGMAIVESQKDTPDQQRIANLVASAVNQAREATRLAPKDVATWDFLAAMYSTAQPLSTNANTFTVSALEQAIKLEKTNPRLYVDLGKAKIQQKDFKGGREALERAVALKSDYVLGYFTLAQLDEVEDKINEAIERMSVAAALSQNDPTVIFNLGRLYYNRAKQDDLVRASQLFAIAISLNPNYSDALWSQGVLFERQGRTSEALQMYRRVQKLNPDNQAVREKINQLAE